MNGSIPVLKGTAWWVLSVYTKGTTPKYNHIFPPYLFCNNGRFEIQTANFQAGNYKVQGNKLIQTSDGSDQLTSTYTITWNEKEKYLELTSGNMVIRLRYNKKAAC